MELKKVSASDSLGEKIKVHLGRKTSDVIDFVWFTPTVNGTKKGYEVSIEQFNVSVRDQKARWSGPLSLLAVILARYKASTGYDYERGESTHKDRRRVLVQPALDGYMVSLDNVYVHHIHDDGSIFLYGGILQELARRGGDMRFYTSRMWLTF